MVAGCRSGDGKIQVVAAAGEADLFKCIDVDGSEHDDLSLIHLNSDSEFIIGQFDLFVIYYMYVLSKSQLLFSRYVQESFTIGHSVLILV